MTKEKKKKKFFYLIYIILIVLAIILASISLVLNFTGYIELSTMFTLVKITLALLVASIFFKANI